MRPYLGKLWYALIKANLIKIFIFKDQNKIVYMLKQNYIHYLKKYKTKCKYNSTITQYYITRWHPSTKFQNIPIII